MVSSPVRQTPVMRFVRTALGADADGPLDAELLARFVADRDAGAFELLVWRHSGTVIGVARAVTRDHHRAEDIAQATFLTLARKARDIGKRTSLSAWLHAVAYRMALRVAKREAQRLAVEVAAPATAEAEAGIDSETLQQLHAAVAGLPEKYRAPVILCFFDGLSNADAARRLGWPIGTVAGRIARAKQLLHRRLTGQGLTPTVLALGTLQLAPVVSSAFVAATSRLITEFATGRSALAFTPALKLSNEAVRTMTMRKIQSAGLAMALAGVLFAGTLGAIGQGPEKSTPVKAAEPAPAAAKAGPRTADFAQRVRSQKNLRTIVQAMYKYLDMHGRLPADVTDKNGKPILSWRVALLPFLDQDALAKSFRMEEPWDSEHNAKLAARMPEVYRMGFEARDATQTHYQQFLLQDRLHREHDGLFVQPRPLSAAAKDGIAVTLALAEAGPAVTWTKPGDIVVDPYDKTFAFARPFANVLHVAAYDGVTHAVDPKFADRMPMEYITPADGQPARPLRTLRARFPVEGEEEKKFLAKQSAANKARIAEIQKQYKEAIELLNQLNDQADDLTTSEDITVLLEQYLDISKHWNKYTRDEINRTRPRKK